METKFTGIAVTPGVTPEFAGLMTVVLNLFHELAESGALDRSKLKDRIDKHVAETKDHPGTRLVVGMMANGLVSRKV